jgi:hypothetical protein
MIRIAGELANGLGTWEVAATVVFATVVFAAAMLASGMFTPAAAQSAGGPGGGRGGRGADNNSPMNAPDPHVIAMAKAISADPEDPLPMILADRNEIKLTDSQTVSLSMMESRLRIDNGPLHDKLDELRPPGVNAKPDYAHLDAAGRDSLIKTRAAIAQTMGAIHDNDLKVRQAAFEVLNPDQRNAITDLEKRVRTMLNTGIPADDAEGGHSGGHHPGGQSGGSG